jgi:hypothetical protein
MSETKLRQEIRTMQFEEIYGLKLSKKLGVEEDTKLLGIHEL